MVESFNKQASVVLNTTSETISARCTDSCCLAEYKKKEFKSGYSVAQKPTRTQSVNKERGGGENTQEPWQRASVCGPHQPDLDSPDRSSSHLNTHTRTWTHTLLSHPFQCFFPLFLHLLFYYSCKVNQWQCTCTKHNDDQLEINYIFLFITLSLKPAKCILI